ncbi:MAG: hypothetical protein IJ668_05215 [Selenomonadaceae bacterium]|nr:hypothetical protein [Selenomonadaceae bacterium]
MKNLSDALAGCNTEEEVKFAFVRYFSRMFKSKFKFDSRKNIDFYTPQILFEFKFDANLNAVANRARAFAQSLYYIRRLTYGTDDRVPSRYVCVVDKHSAAIVPVELLKNYFSKRQPDIYDWDLAPSTPCKKLRADLSVEPIIINCRVFDFDADQDAFVDRIRNIYLQPSGDAPNVKKEINEFNFHAIFDEWDRQFGDSVANSHKPSEYFLTDVESGKSAVVEDRTVLFRLGDGTRSEKVMPIDSYKMFWGRHDRVSDARTMIAIRQKMDRMTAIEFRRFTGEFFTPIDHARKALEYIERVLGAEWWRTGRYRLWDMAAGTGNLEYALKGEALQYCYISTLLKDDAAYCGKIYPSATVFQYDYLNDGREKLPPKLRADLDDLDIKWIVLINPPYVTANNRERDKTKITKTTVSMTTIRQLMIDDDIAEVSRELSSQFFYRIDREFRDRQTILGVFSKIKYINAPYDQGLRDRFFDYKFEGGFLFPSKAFQGTKGQFPVGFAMWNLAEHIPLSDQTIEFDVMNDRLEKIAVKKISSVPRGALLNEWIDRPPTIKIFPPMSSALNVSYNSREQRNRIAEGFLLSLLANGNDLMHQNNTALLSGPYGSPGGMSVTAENFERAMVVHAVRRLPRASWLNDKDQFLQPSKPLPPEFVDDCVVWSLFAPSNNTASLLNVEYEGTVYRIINHLYPWTIDELSTWQCSDLELLYPLVSEEERFAARWLGAKKLSAEADSVLNEARSIYQRFYARLNELDRKKYRLEAWDVGWYQVRRSLEEARLLDGDRFRLAFDRLGAKLLPQVYSLGFLLNDVTYFD